MSYLDTDNCLHCGKQFIKTRPDKVYCTYKCGTNYATVIHEDLLQGLINWFLPSEVEKVKKEHPKISSELVNRLAYNNLRNLLTTAELRSKKFKEIFLNKVTERYGSREDV